MLRHSVAAQAKKPVPAFTKVPSQGRRPSSEAGRDHHFDVCEEARRTWWTPWRHGSEAAHGRRRYVRAEREARQRWRAGRQRRWPQASASWRSGGFSQRQIMPEAAFSSGQPRSARPAGLAVPPGHIGLAFDSGALIGLLPGDGLIVVNAQQCVDAQQVEMTITNCMSCTLKVKRGLPETSGAST